MGSEMCIRDRSDILRDIARADWTSFILRAADGHEDATAMERLLAVVEPYARAA